MRILMIGFGDAALTPGGAQLIAAEMLAEANARGFVAHYIAALDPGEALRFARPESRLTPAPGAPGVSYFLPRAFNYDLLACGDWRAIAELREFIRFFQPDVVHFHHYLGLGMEAIVAARQAAPKATLTVTFHEMVAICAANGQMVKIPSRDVCLAPTPEACAQCKPARAPDYFALRANRLLQAFEWVDGFVFPSHALADIYVDWGLPAEKCAVIANGLANCVPHFDIRRHSPDVNRFAFFGQLIENKGLEVALRAFGRLARERRAPACGIELQINGANRKYAPPEYLTLIDNLAVEAKTASGNLIRISDRGAYDREELSGRMADADWVIAPSTWPESFALVVSEAWMFGRPVIVSDLGALSERVRDGVDGFKFAARDDRALAERIVGLVGDVERWRRMSNAIETQPSATEMFDAYLAFWREAKL